MLNENTPLETGRGSLFGTSKKTGNGINTPKSYPSQNKYDYTALNQAALAQCPGLLEKLLPGGKLSGHEYECSNLQGGSGKSCKINTETGKWSDFATGEGGGDLIRLVAAINQCGQGEAHKILAGLIGFTLPDRAATTASKKNDRQKDKPQAIMPVPEDVAATLPDMTHPRHGKPTEYYPSRDQDGQLLFYACRFTKQEVDARGKHKKEFSPLIYTAQGWRWQFPPQPYPFYGLQTLPELPLEAPIIVTEGEHKSDLLRAKIGTDAIVLSIFGGSGGADKMDCSLLRGRKVFYWPDNDKPGIKAAMAFAGKVKGLAASLRIILPPEDKPESWDAANAIQDDKWDHAQIMKFLTTASHEPAEFERLAGERWGIAEAEIDDECQTTSENILLPDLPRPPLDVFPIQVQELLSNAQRAFNVDPAMPVCCLLAVLSMSIEQARLIQKNETYDQAANLFIGLVATSGAGKSPLLNEFMKPIKDIERQFRKNFDLEYEIYQQELEKWQKDKTKAKPVMPRQRQLYADDVTIERLSEILRDNPKGVCLMRDEISGLFADAGKYSGSAQSEKSRFLSAYDRQPWIIGRVSKDRNIYIPEACLSIVGGIQPARLREIFETGESGSDVTSGLLPRFIFIWASSQRPIPGQAPCFEKKYRELLSAIITHMCRWDIEFDNAGNEINRFINLSGEAEAYFDQWRYETEMQGYLDPPHEPMLKKLTAQCLRICLIMHCLDCVLAGMSEFEPVPLDCMKQTIKLMEWIKLHQLKVWRLFLNEGKKFVNPDPLQRAIIDTCNANRDKIVNAGYKILSCELIQQVGERLGVKVNHKQVGAAANKLGLISGQRIKNDRAWAVKLETLKSFSDLSGRSVRSVHEPHEYWISGQDGSVHDPYDPYMDLACPQDTPKHFTDGLSTDRTDNVRIMYRSDTPKTRMNTGKCTDRTDSADNPRQAAPKSSYRHLEII